MLRITKPGPVTLVTIGLEGKLLGAWVDEAHLVIAAARATDAICLNLKGLTFADTRGIELLRTLRGDGIPLIGGSALIEGLLALNEDDAKRIVSETISPDE